jgi:hypothetical protein
MTNTTFEAIEKLYVRPKRQGVISPNVIKTRLKLGWEPARAVLEPVRPRRRNRERG